ncbi:mavicyanin-like [Nymphaea colorata]|nr:mavicyanin-like [Nymphaea colorata]
MAAIKISVAVVIMAVLINMGECTNHTVGAPTGNWDMSTSLQAWASFQAFHPGDTLIFRYVAIVHDVVEVPKSDFDACQVTNPLSSHNDGDTAIPLTTIGKRYFICGVPGHCNLGMKVEIETVAPGTRQHPFVLSPATQPELPPPDTPFSGTNTGNPSVVTGTLGSSTNTASRTTSSSSPNFGPHLGYLVLVALLLITSV